MRLIKSFLLAVCILYTVQVQAADLQFPELSGRIVDQAHVFQPQTKTDLEIRLADFEARTDHQIVVVTLPTLNGQEIADYTYQLGRHWEIGQKGKNNGAIILVVPSERVARIEAGYGLEGDLTDAASAIVINNIMIPFFKKGDYETGIVQGTDAVMQIIQGDQQAVFKKAKAKQEHDDLLTAIIIAYIIFWLIIRWSGGGRRSSGLAPFILGSMIGNGRNGGFDGGSGGGFRGGGGSFGGGGASGRW